MWTFLSMYSPWYDIYNVRFFAFLEIGLDRDDSDTSSSSRHPHHYRRNHESHSNHSTRKYSQPPVEDRVTFLILSDTDRNIKKAKDIFSNVYKCKDIEYSRNKLSSYQVRLPEMKLCSVDFGHDIPLLF